MIQLIKKQVLIGAIAAIAIWSCHTPAETSSEQDMAKDTYQIKGTLAPEYRGLIDTVFLINDNDLPFDTALVKNNTFELTGSVKEPIHVGIGYHGDKVQAGGEMILENHTYQVEIKSTGTEVKGGEIHPKIYGYYNDPTFKKYDLAHTAWMNSFKEEWMNDEPRLKVFRQVNDSLENVMYGIQTKHLDNIIKGNDPAITKAFAIAAIQDWKAYPPAKKIELLNQYEKETGPREVITNYRNFMIENLKEEANRIEIANGSIFKDVTALDRNGKSHKLADVVAKNKFTILEFWASWCGPCRAEIPNLKKAYAKYKHKGLEIYSVSLDSNIGAWHKALDKEQTNWINLVDTRAFDSPLSKSYGVEGIPASFLISQSGKIVAQNNELREFDLDRTLNKFLK